MRLAPSFLGTACVRRIARDVGSEVSFHLLLSVVANVAISAWLRVVSRFSSSTVRGRDFGGGGPLMPSDALFELLEEVGHVANLTG